MKNSTTDFVKNKNNLEHNFTLYLKEKLPHLKITIDTFFSDGLFLANNNLSLDFWEILNDEN